MDNSQDMQYENVVVGQPCFHGGISDFLSDNVTVEQTFDFYSRALTGNDIVLKYLEKRGIKSLELLKKHRIGLSDRTLGLSLGKLDRNDEEGQRGSLLRSGLFKGSGHELFRGCVIFPFINDDDDIIGAYGRRITPKLKARSAYHVHWLSGELGFFNQKALSEHSEIILSKSPIECLTWLSAGFKNVVGLMGYKGFTHEHLKILQSRSVKLVYIAFGSSKLEFLVAQDLAQLLMESGVAIRFVFFPDGKDANGYCLTSETPIADLSELLRYSLVPCASLASSTGGNDEYA